jgi:hypothetical protein
MITSEGLNKLEEIQGPPPRLLAARDAPCTIPEIVLYSFGKTQIAA